VTPRAPHTSRAVDHMASLWLIISPCATPCAHGSPQGLHRVRSHFDNGRDPAVMQVRELIMSRLEGVDVRAWGLAHRSWTPLKRQIA
jgi:hypothetical protein